jgi:CheY-like chemotaxis protein
MADEFCEAADGEKGIEKIRELRPDLVLLDLSMPCMNGLEAARELRRLHPSLPLLMFTSFKTPNLEEQAIAAGCNTLVSKSDSGQLLSSMQRLLPGVA